MAGRTDCKKRLKPAPLPLRIREARNRSKSRLRANSTSEEEAEGRSKSQSQGCHQQQQEQKVSWAHVVKPLSAPSPDFLANTHQQQQITKLEKMVESLRELNTKLMKSKLQVP